MSGQEFRANDVAIIATSCLLPDASTPDEFWRLCLEAKPKFQKISEERLKGYLFHETDQTHLRITSRLACEIDLDQVKKLLPASELPVGKRNRLALYAEYASKKLFEAVGASNRGRVQDIFIGCMNPDTLFELQVARERQDAHVAELRSCLGDKKEFDVLDDLTERALTSVTREHHADPDHFFTTSILARIAAHYDLRGEQILVDSACASSLSAIDLAVQRLILGESDFAVVGGFESNLGQASYMIFSSVGALAPENSVPFRPGSQGLVQSEGVVLFALKRIGDALKDGDQVLGVIRGVAGSGDGRSASLFQPNKDGQVRVYEKIYGKNRSLHYLEAHGTGTEVGDKTEAESIKEFFRGQRFPVGSVKALIGHTKGTAGATGLLKCLSVLKEKVIPPVTSAENTLFDTDSVGPYMNTAPVKAEAGSPVRIGINSFGFGGTNYHLLLEEYLPGARITEEIDFREQEIGILAEASMDLEGFRREDFFRYDCPFKLPPNSAAGIDKTQLLALLTAWSAIRDLGPLWAWIPKNRVNVVSACSLGLDQVFEIADRLIFEAIVRLGESEGKHPEVLSKLRTYINDEIESRYAPINEDAATGVLNNVIAGRICNAFDLHGKSYNVDMDIASGPAAMNAVLRDLKIDPRQVFLLVSVTEEMKEGALKPERKRVTTRILTSQLFAREMELPLRHLVETA